MSPNLLMVHVNNQNNQIPPLSGDFTIFGGIYRDVWLISVGKATHQPHRLRLSRCLCRFAFRE